MPKIFTDSDKFKWLEFYESGKSEKWIRARVKCDLRTVHKGIQEARVKREARAARGDLVKEALRKHQSRLLEEIDAIVSTLMVPTEDFAVLSWYHTRGDSIFTPPSTSSENKAGEELKYTEDSESEPQIFRRLLKQHLKNDRIWKVLASWDKSRTAHLAARTALQLKTVSILKEKTGCDVVDNEQVPRPFFYSYTAGDVFYKAALQAAFGTSKSKDLEKHLENKITAEVNSGEVRYPGVILALVNPGDEEKTKANLIKAFKELEKSPEIAPVVETYISLKELTSKARHAVEQIKLLGLVPGQCEICRRIGM